MDRQKHQAPGADTLRQALRLYVVSDRDLAGGRPEEDILRAAAAGGATAFQLRGKDWDGNELYQVGRRLAAVSHQLGVLFIVNDRVDIALACDADGVHLGQSDLPLGAARALLGPHRVIGVTASTTEQARIAERNGSDYIGASPVWTTPTKTDTNAALGLEGLEDMCQAVSIPVVGIGGINEKNAARVMRAGAAGIAVVSAVVSHPDPRAASSGLLQAMDS